MVKNKKIYALICCRGGSKGIPKKNIKMFAKKPLLFWIINEAKKSKIFDKIILSTDSLNILKIAESYGIFVPGLRPKKLAKDESDVFDTHKYIFSKLKLNDKNSHICVLNNNPFINSNLIKKSFEISKKNNFNSLVLDSKKIRSDYIYYRQMKFKKNKLLSVFPKDFIKSKINRQSDVKYFSTINNIRWGKPSILSNYEIYKKHILKNGVHPIELSKVRDFDLDDHDDWKIAEIIFRNLIL